MGRYATPPDWAESGDEADDTTAKLGEVLSGRLADVDSDSVEALRDAR